VGIIEEKQPVPEQRQLYCATMVGWTASWCPLTEAITKVVKKDWPSQVVYLGAILSTLISSQTCVNTTYAADPATWLNVYQSNQSLWGSLLETWMIP